MTKSFEEHINFVENQLGIKLLDYQKEIMRRYYDKHNLYITYPPQLDRTDLRVLLASMKELLKEN